MRVMDWLSRLSKTNGLNAHTVAVRKWKSLIAKNAMVAVGLMTPAVAQ